MSESVGGGSETMQEGEHRDESSSHVRDPHHEASDSPCPGKRRRRRSRRQWYRVIARLLIKRRWRRSSKKKLAIIHFASPLPRRPSPPAQQFRLTQGHKLIFTVSYREPHYIFTVMAAEEKLQKRELNWPLKESFVLILHKTKDKEGRPMERDAAR